LYSSVNGQTKSKISGLARAITKDLMNYQILTVAITDFANQNNSYTGLSRYLAEETVGILQAIKTFKIPEVNRVAEVMVKSAMTPATFSNIDKLYALGKELDAEIIGVGSYKEVTGGISVKVALIASSGGQVMATETVEIPLDASLEGLLKSPGPQLYAPPVQQQPPTPKVDQPEKKQSDPTPTPRPESAPKQVEQSKPASETSAGIVPSASEMKLIHASAGDYIDVTRSKSSSTFSSTSKDKLGENIGVIDDWGGRRDVAKIHPIDRGNPAFLELTTVIPNDGTPCKLVVAIRSESNGDFDVQILARDEESTTFEVQPKKAIIPAKAWYDLEFPLDAFKGKRITIILYDWPSGWAFEGCYVDRFYICRGSVQ
jgi:hypothetical protein